MNDSIMLVVVDDEQDIFKLYEIFLKDEIDEGIITLHSFENGRKCLDHFQENVKEDQRAIVLSDINMPEMDGYELVAELSKTWKSADVYMVTAYSREEYDNKAKAHGAKGLIAKPVDFAELKTLIMSYH